MRVLHVINTLDRGGAEQLLIAMLPALCRAGVDARLHVLALRDRRLFDRLVAMGVRVSHGRANQLYDVRNVDILGAEIRSHRADIVHAHLFPAMLWAAAAAFFTPGVRLVTTEHDTYNRRRKFWWWPMEWAMYRRYDAIACISDPTEAALVQWLPFTKRRSTVIPNGIELSRFALAPRGSCDDPAVVLSVGRVIHKKGFDVLIRAVALLPGVRLRLVGDGPARRELESLADTLGVRDQVEFLGVRDDIPALLAEATIYVQPSRWEGFGLAAVEAMASGKAVIVSDVPGLREVVGHGGLTFPPESHVELAALLRRALEDGAARRRLGDLARERAKEFSLSRSVERYLELYSSVMASNGAGAQRAQPAA